MLQHYTSGPCLFTIVNIVRLFSMALSYVVTIVYLKPLKSALLLLRSSKNSILHYFHTVQLKLFRLTFIINQSIPNPTQSLLNWNFGIQFLLNNWHETFLKVLGAFFVCFFKKDWNGKNGSAYKNVFYFGNVRKNEEKLYPIFFDNSVLWCRMPLGCCWPSHSQQDSLLFLAFEMALFTDMRQWKKGKLYARLLFKTALRQVFSLIIRAFLLQEKCIATAAICRSIKKTFLCIHFSYYCFTPFSVLPLWNWVMFIHNTHQKPVNCHLLSKTRTNFRRGVVKFPRQGRRT